MASDEPTATMARGRSPSPLSSGEITPNSDNQKSSVSITNPQLPKEAYVKTHLKGCHDYIKMDANPDGKPLNRNEFSSQETFYRLARDPYFHFREDDAHPPLSFISRNHSQSRSRSPPRAGQLTKEEWVARDKELYGHLVKTDDQGRLIKRTHSPQKEERGDDKEHGKSHGTHQRVEKRGRRNDHYDRKDNSDPRRFKTYYEDSYYEEPYHEDPYKRAPLPKELLDRPVWKENESSHHQDQQSHRNRQPHRGNYQSRSEAQDRGRRRNRSPLSPRNRYSSGSEIAGHEQGKPDSRQEVEAPQESITKPDTQVDHKSNQEAEERVSEPEPELSEAEQIEQRRKMREAIRAKHRNNAPLLVQALEQNMSSAPATPLHDSSTAVSEQHSPISTGSPGTPNHDSPPGSPAPYAISGDEELVERRTVNGVGNEDDGPSAADYDPNLDMQEDRPDHKRIDVKDAANDVSLDLRSEPKRKEYDMFADDDDDDMFAPVDSTAKPLANNALQGRTLDASMLDNWDYPDGHYKIILGELLDERYAVQQQIGKGTFATVVRAQDTRTGDQVAIKIACNNQTMYKAGQKEMDMLRLLNEQDPSDKKHIIRLHRHFEHKGHLCIVFENLSADLREILKKFGRNVGLNLQAIREYARQMFTALGHLKKCEILHADLKPDNMLVNEKRTVLKICDLGTASFASDAEITPYLVSRFYRAPEVILGAEFDYAIDMWSVGCTLFELYTGRILFAGADNNQMLRAIQECRGKIPNRILKRSNLVDKHFDSEGNLISQEYDKLTGKATIRKLNFNKTVAGKDLRARLSGNVKGMKPDDVKEHTAFVDLLEKCLQLDPQRRISPNEALRHHFVSHADKKNEPSSSAVRPAMNAPRKV